MYTGSTSHLNCSTPMHESQGSSRDIQICFNRIVRTASSYHAGDSDLLCVMTQQQEAQHQQRNTRSQPSQQCQGKWTDQEYLSVELLLLRGQRFGTEQGQRLGGARWGIKIRSWSRRLHLCCALKNVHRRPRECPD